MFGRCIITWFILSLKVFIAFYRIFTYFKIYFYWVDIPEFIFWMKLWILWKDTDVSFFIDCSMFLVSSIGDVSRQLCALWKAMQKRWGRLRTWIVIRRRKSILLLFWNSSREPQLRNLLLSLNPLRKSQSKSNCGRKYGQSHFDFRKSHNLQLCLSHQKMFLLLHQNALDLLAYRREIWDTMLPLKALFLRVWTNDHQNFELRVSDIFENWRRMVFQC